VMVEEVVLVRWSGGNTGWSLTLDVFVTLC